MDLLLLRLFALVIFISGQFVAWILFSLTPPLQSPEQNHPGLGPVGAVKARRVWRSCTSCEWQCHVPSVAGMEFSRGTGDGWVGEGRSEDHNSGKVTALPALALESRRLQACPDVERSIQRPPAQRGERFLPGRFSGVLPPFGSVGEGV